MLAGDNLDQHTSLPLISPWKPALPHATMK